MKKDVLAEILNIMFNIVEKDAFAYSENFKTVKRELEKFKYSMYEEFVAYGIIFAANVMKNNLQESVKDKNVQKMYVSILKKNLLKKNSLTDRSFYDIKNVSVDDRAELFKICLQNNQMIYAQNIGTSFYSAISDNSQEKNQFFKEILPFMEEKMQNLRKEFKDGDVIFDTIDDYLSIIQNISRLYRFNVERARGENSSIKQEFLQRFANIQNDLKYLEFEYINELKKIQGQEPYTEEDFLLRNNTEDKKEFLLQGQDREEYIQKTYGSFFKE